VFPVGLVGFMAALLWYINTSYAAALPFWLLSSVLLLLVATATPAAPSTQGGAVSRLGRDP